ncbi:type II toxin-antitoxin system RelE/ParE family toxin [Bordetella hinzii]|uniref:type II toxin-antitoxin system RelE/ParE family toxin n=1 Tax=Bordetella hinzii TaxID=103855 RepID=UPI003F1ACFBB
MKVEWSAFAMEDRDRIFDYIESESPKAAVLVDSRIEEQVNQLAQFPEFGRPGRVDDTRELVIGQTPYIVPYRVYGDVVRILRVLHGAQQWPDDLGD